MLCRQPLYSPAGFSQITASAASAFTGGVGQGVTGRAVASRQLDMPTSTSSQVRVAPPSSGPEASLSALGVGRAEGLWPPSHSSGFPSVHPDEQLQSIVSVKRG